MLLLLSGSAHAGPPLDSDDPHAIGAGNLELNVAVAAIGIGDYTELGAPIFDITLGLLPGIDIGVVGAPIFEFGPEEELLGSDGAFAAFVKWQPLRGEHWNASITPAIGFGFPTANEFEFFLPVQVEYQRADFMVGTDLGWLFVTNAPDLWRAGAYGGYTVAEGLDLLGEMVWFRSAFDLDAQVGLNFGFDWQTPLGPHLLASAGPAFEVFEGGKLEWRAYLGLQWTFALWSPR